MSTASLVSFCSALSSLTSFRASPNCISSFSTC
eukprot:CAMPEP_0182879962 /NCGR_PEP_ID=MMETSP0034_2-20130328/16289_1 /TAXON_ID=156128 /ORGANISM="Nephroselmis pyriformis, Strain CCMP717" /LENGTH=32 /DNA_ID= /DNA_START= /DNA_END= /DNA_ORIENTATION=